MEKGTYQTAGRRRLMDFFIRNPDKQFSAEDIAAGVNADVTGEKPLGQSTVYRQVTRLCEEGILRRFRPENEDRTLYQYVGGSLDCSHHFHLKCIRCGKLFHLDCHMSDELIAHIQVEHGFAVDSGRSILYGFCRECDPDRIHPQRLVDSRS